MPTKGTDGSFFAFGAPSFKVCRPCGGVDVNDSKIIDALRSNAVSLTSAADVDPLLEKIGDARYVLLGEASHGTSEYYSWRAELSLRLIREKGFSFVAVEGDWPDCYRVNRTVKVAPGASEGVFDSLHAYDRWPTWMWANWEVVAFAERLREHNFTVPLERMVGFYGLDVYSLWESMDVVLRHLHTAHPESVDVAKAAFACFDPFGRDGQAYAWSTKFGASNCKDEVQRLLMKLMQTRYREEGDDPESHFDAEMNAWAAVNAERYYRTMMAGDVSSWNVRDHHMVDTLERLMARHGPEAKGIVWEHNTHVGDARATDMGREGMINVGQLVRERHGAQNVFIVGFGSHHGSVVASRAWGDQMERMTVPPAGSGSWEALMHEADLQQALYFTQNLGDVGSEERGHRAIGVVYRPEREAQGNYVPTVLGERYDAFIYLDETHALHPLHVQPTDKHEPPETYPFAL